MKTKHTLLLTTICLSSLFLTGCPQQPEQTLIPPSDNSSVVASTSSVPLPEGYTGIMVDDLEDGDRFNSFRGTWFTYDDSNSGGDSQLTPAAFSTFSPLQGGPLSSSQYAKITGNVTTTYPDGFVGIGMDLNPNNNQPRDLSQYKAIEFWTRGDGKTYRFKIHSTATADYDDYGYNFTTSSEWERHVIPFEDLTQEGWGKSVSLEQAIQKALKLQWQTIGQPHESITLEIDNIRLLKAN